METQFTFEPNEVLDMDSGLGRVRGKKSIYKRMLGLFQKSDEFQKFDDFLEAGDFEKASESAHAIKGMTGNLGMNALFKTSEKLMVQLRQGPADPESLAEYRAALTQTQQAVENAIPELND